MVFPGVLAGFLLTVVWSAPFVDTVVSAISLLAAGVFTFLYWDVRLLATRDVLPWYPLAPWV